MVPEAPIIVDVLAPDNGAEVVLGNFLSVSAKAFSLENPLATFEFWADGQLFAQEAVSGDTAEVSWSWQALSQGVHTFFVRVKDVQGRTGQSQVVIVNVLEGDGKIQVQAQEGQTLDEIGGQFNILPDQMATSNPGLGPLQPLQEGQPVQVPIDGGKTEQGSEQGDDQPPNIPTQPPDAPPNPVIFWINQKFFPIPKSLPAQPMVDIALVDCTNRLYIIPQSNDATGFIVYRYVTGYTGFQKIAILGPGEEGIPIVFDDWITPNGLNFYQYYVSAFNILGESPSSIVYQSQGYFSNCQPTVPNVQLGQMHWHLMTTETMEKYYCYQSSGDGIWQRIPADPFTFFDGQNGDYDQLGPFNSDKEIQLQMQCWGWQAESLKYLGEGVKKVSLEQPPAEVVIEGGGFVITGMPDFKPKPEKLLGGGELTVPAPYALREASAAAECVSHYGNPLAGLVCNGLLNAQVKEYYTLVWEWQPKTCWPGGNCVWVNDIDGYYIYEIDPMTNSQTYLKEVNKPNQKVTAVPLPWGYRCYGVKAYAEGPELGGQIVSEMETYCPGEPPKPEKIVLSPSNWLTAGGQWIQSGDCDTYGGLESYAVYQNGGLLDSNAGQVLVGSYIVDDNNQDCFRQGDYSGAVKFAIPILQPGAVFQKAVLKFSSVFNDYEASGLATNYKHFCVDGVGKAKQDWTGLGNNLFLGDNVLYAYNVPLTSLSAWQLSLDVTSAVSNWLKHPNQNHGFILTPSSAPSPLTDGHGTCMSGVGNFQLEIYYFIP